MSEFFTCIISKNGLAYLTGVVIFLITLFLTSKKIIGFTLTLLLLIFALVAALAVANQDVIRGYFVHTSDQPTPGVYQSNTQTPPAKETANNLNAEIQKAFDDLKKEVTIEKDRLKQMWEDFYNSKEHESKNSSDKKDKDSSP